MHMRSRSITSPPKAVPSLETNGSIELSPSTTTIGRRTRRKRRRTSSSSILFLRPRQAFVLAVTVIVGLAIVSITYVVSRILHITHASTQHAFYLDSPNAPSCSEPLHADDVSYTLVTQMNDDRLWMMEYHCQRWGSNTMSIAVLSEHSYEQVWKTLTEDLRCDAESLTLSVLSSRNYPQDDYPVNVLRNLAISQVRTSHLVYIDVDFWGSTNLVEVLHHNDTVRSALASDPYLALVIPAFQLFRQCEDWIDCKDKNIPLMPETQPELYTVLKSKKAHMFDPTNKGGHGSTRYKDWLVDQEEGELLEIDCILSNRYEPFVVVRYCRQLPPFQEAFSGYGKNKMTWMMQLIRSGYGLAQIGGAFLVHYPHLDSKSRMHWNEAPKELVVKNQEGKPQFIRRPEQKDAGVVDFGNYKRGQVDATFVEFRNWLEEHVPEDKRRVPRCKDAQDDDSKLWIDRSANKRYDIPNPIIPNQ